MSTYNSFKLYGKDAFISFLSNCDDKTFSRAIKYINMKGFLEGLHDHLLFNNENILIEAMEYANSSYDLVREYLKEKQDADFNDYQNLAED